MNYKKQKEGLGNILPGKPGYDECDVMIHELLQDAGVVKGFIKASEKDGVPLPEIKKQLQYFGARQLSLK